MFYLKKKKKKKKKKTFQVNYILINYKIMKSDSVAVFPAKTI